MYEPVPARYVGWYFNKIHEFFLFEGVEIPLKNVPLTFEVEYFFRCVYSLPSFDFQLSLNQIDSYASSKLSSSYTGFMKICRRMGYKPFGCIDWNSEFASDFLEAKNPSLLEILIKLRQGFTYILDDSNSTSSDLNLAQRDVLKFMIYVIDFLFKERKARESGKNLDLPEGIVLKLHDVLNHAFKAHLGVKLPEREDDGVLADFPSYIYRLSHCWKDSQGNEI